MKLFINPKSEVNPDIPNLQLVYAATIENKKGAKAKIVDLNAKRDDDERFLNDKAGKVFISIRPFTKETAVDIANKYLLKYNKAKIYSVLGIIDVLCCYPFLPFESSNKFKIKNYNIKFSDNLPFPKYELLDSFEVFNQNWKSGVWNYPIMTSLGCPYQCMYCLSRCRKWQKRSARNCYEELKQAKEKYCIRQFSIVDDCFNADKERLIEFCNLVKKLKLKWLCTNGLRADRFDEDIAKAMSEAGCMHVGFGAECLDDSVLKNIKKGLSVEQIKKAVKIAKKYFREVHCFFIIGLPGSSYEKDINSLRWVIREGISGHFSCYVPFDKNYGDESFYGKKAKVKSLEYSKKQQEKIYYLTRFMRGDIKSPFIFRALNRLKLIWLFDKKNMLGHIKEELKNRFGK